MSDDLGSNLSSLRRRLAALFAVTAAAVIAGGVAYNNSYRASLVRDSETLLTSIEDFKIQQITYWRNDRLDDTMSLLDSPLLSTYLNDLAVNPSNSAAKAMLSKRLEAYLRNNRYTEALLTEIDGKVLVSAGKRSKNACPGSGAILDKANASGRPEMGDFNVLPGEKNPHIDLVTRAAKGPGGKNLFLLLRIDPKDYLYPLLEKWPTNSRTGETLLVSRAGNKIVYLNELRHISGAAMKLQFPENTPNLPAAIAFTGKSGIVRGRDYRGVEVLASVSTIPGTNWAIVTKMDMAEVLAGSGRVSLLLLLLVLSLLGTAGAGTYLVFRRQAEEYRRSYAELDREASALKDNYARLTAQANDAIIIADAQTLRIIETNRKSHEMYGYTEEEFLRLKISDLVPESGLARQQERLKAVRSGPGAVVEAEHKRKNGELFHAEVSASCTSGSGKEYIFAIVRDLSERVRMEQAVCDSEENYRQLFEAESDAIFLIDNENGELKQANNAASVLYGYTLEELLAMRNTDLSAEPEDTSKVTRNTPLDPGKVVVIPLRYHRKKNGEVFPVEITGRFFTRHGRPVHLVAIRDITERKKAEESLRLGEERLRMAAEAAQFGVYDYDIETGSRSYSPEFLGLFGLPPGAALPLDEDQAPKALYPEDRKGFIAARRAGYDPLGTGLVEHEFRVILPTGQVRWLRVRGRTVFTGTGAGARPLRANGIIQDVTEKKHAELTLLESEERYRSLFENMLNGFAYCRMLFENGKPADFVYLSVNKAFDTLTGLKGVAGKKVSEVIPGIRETDPGLLETYGRVALGGKPETFETYVKALKMWFSISVYSPAKEHFVAVFDVITERKQAEEALKQSNALMDTTQHLAGIGGWEWDLAAKTMHWTKETYIIHDFDPSDLEPSPEAHIARSQLCYSLEDRTVLMAAFNRCVESGEPYDLELAFTSAKGRRLWVRSTGSAERQGGKIVKVLGTLSDVTSAKLANDALKASEGSVRNKLNAIMEPEGDIGTLGLSDIFDIPALQGMMDELYKLTNITSAILDMDGKVLVATGWQDICTKFHRVNPESCRHCLESDTLLAKDIPPGASKSYFCRNNMRDIATPLMVGGRHVGNLFLGQFLYTDDPRDYEIFREQARRYGFDEKEYLAAYDRIPVFSREKIEILITFYRQVGDLISTLSYGRIKLARALEQSRRTGEMLAENERALREAQEMAHLGYWNWNVKTGSVDWSEEVFRIFRLDPEKFTPQIDSIMELSPWPEENERDKELIRRATKTREKGTYTQRFLRPDKSIGYYHSTFQGKYDEHGGLTSIVGTILDITELKLAELALEKLNRDLVEKKQEMENFLYITTHDLRGPLVNIQGFSQNLEHYLAELKERLGAAALPAGPKEALEKLTGDRIPTALRFILESSRKMDALITALLKVSRLGRVEMKPETVDMNGLVDKVAESLRYQLEQAGGEVKHGDLPRCKADPGAVSQLFANLLDNAIKYRQEGRPLSVRVTAEVKEGMVLYCVADNASGIPEKDLTRIWDIFYRHETAGEKSGGEGIGLPMVKRIAEKNGGNITVASKPGEGSVFRVSLPAA